MHFLKWSSTLNLCFTWHMHKLLPSEQLWPPLRILHVAIICAWMWFQPLSSIQSPTVSIFLFNPPQSNSRRLAPNSAPQSAKWPQQHPPAHCLWRRLPSIRVSRTRTKPSTATKAIWTSIAARRWRARATRCASTLSTYTAICAPMRGLQSGTTSAGRVPLRAESKQCMVEGQRLIDFGSVAGWMVQCFSRM